MLSIETRGLGKRYRGGTIGLHPLDLKVPAGVCFGLLGPNGAGKSTLVKSLLTIIRATSGEALLLGRDHRDPEARRGVGYLAEGHAFPEVLTGREVCRYMGRLGGLWGGELEARIDKTVQRVGMAARCDERVADYSKGMKQRIGHRAGLARRPAAGVPRRADRRRGPSRAQGDPRDRAGTGGRREDGVRQLPPARRARDDVRRGSRAAPRTAADPGEACRREGEHREASRHAGDVQSDAVPARSRPPARRRGRRHRAARLDVRAADRRRRHRRRGRCAARRGIGIRAIQPRAVSLEDAFVAIVEEAGS